MKHENFQTQQYLLATNAQGFSKNCHEVLLLMISLQTKPQVKNMNIIYYDVYYTVIKARDDKEFIDDKIENIEDDYTNFNDFITPNHDIGEKNNKEKLR